MDKKNIKEIIFFLLTLWAWNSHAIGFPNDDDKTKPKENQTSQGGSAGLSPQMQAQVDAALEKLNAQLNVENVSYVDNFADLKETVSSTTDDERQKALRTFFYLDQNPENYREELNFDDLMMLPVGIRKKLSDNTTADVGIFNAQIFPTYATLTIFVRLKTTITDPNATIKEREIFFGVKDIKFTREGGLTSSFSAVLLGDVILPYGSWVIKLKGNIDLNSGEVPLDATYVTIDCGAFKEAQLDAEIIFPRSIIVPFNSTLRQPEGGTGRVTGAFTAKVTNGLRNFMATTSFDKPFAVAGFSKVGFVVNNVALDLSDVQNPSMTFPVGYNGDMGPTWRGVYIGNFEVLLPREFKENGNSNAISFGAEKVLIDRNGFSGIVKLANNQTFNDVDASGWKLTLNSFRVEFVTNNFKSGTFGGALYVPVSDDPFLYSATIDVTGNYGITVTNTGNIKFDFWKAKATIAPGSLVELKVVNFKFRPKAILNGSLNIASNLGSDVNIDDNNNDATVKFKGIQFAQLQLQTISPKVSIGSISYVNNESGVGRFPVTITQAGLDNTAPNNEFWLKFGVQVNIMDGGVSAATNVTIKAVETNGKLTFKGFSNGGVQVNRVLISGDFTALKLNGEVCIYENPIAGGGQDKGFAGQLNLKVKEPKEINVCVMAQFGRIKGTSDPYRYWRVEGSASGFEIPVAGPLAINGIAVGVYYKMKPATGGGNLTANGCTITGCALTGLNYIPDAATSLGFKAAVNLKLSSPTPDKVFKGMAGFEMVFNSSYGVNSLGFFGEGEVTASASAFVGQNLGDKLKQLSSFATETQNFTQNKLIQKATQQFMGGQQISASGRVAFRFGLLFDFQNKSVHGDAEVFVNIANVLRGVGANDRAGWLSLHFSPQKWYLHVGKPSPMADRIGIKVGIGSISLTTTAYLMVGHEIPNQLPPFPPIVQQMFGNQLPTTRTSSNANAIKTGQGFALGMSVLFDSGDIQIAIFYGRFQFGTGFDVLLSNATNCSGVNNYYALGQLFAYIQGEGGFKLGSKKIRLFQGTIGVKVQGGLPNPMWVDGTAHFCVRVLFVNYCKDFPVRFGNKCM